MIDQHQNMDNESSGTPDLTSVRAIALDTNIFSDAPGIESLGSICRRADVHGRVEIWIADTVVWEWGQHLHETHQKLRAAAKKLQAAGLTVTDPGEKSALMIAGELKATISSLGDSVRILDTSTFAHEGLRDQILLEGPAKRKGDVKTGAADSTHLRAYINEARTRDVDYVIASGDKDIRAAYENWGVPNPPRIYNTHTRAANAVFQAVPSNMDGVKVALSVAYDSTALLRDLVVNDADLRGWRENIPDDFDALSFDIVTPARLVGIDQANQDPTALTFRAFYLANVKVQGLVASSWGFGRTIAPQEAVLFPNALLRVEVSLPSGSMSANDASVTYSQIHTGENEWLDRLDALNSVLEALTLIPCVKEIEWPDDGRKPSSGLIVPIGDEELELSLLGSWWEEWEMSATYRGQEQRLHCFDLGVGDIGPDGAHDYCGIIALGPEQWSENAEFAVNELVFSKGIPGLPGPGTPG